jgi:hypothetical protein
MGNSYEQGENCLTRDAMIWRQGEVKLAVMKKYSRWPNAIYGLEVHPGGQGI